MGRVGSVWETPMFFLRMPSAATNGFNFFNKEWVIREGNDYLTRWIICNKDSCHQATLVLFKVNGRGIGNVYF